jgi:hypothetical protein
MVHGEEKAWEMGRSLLPSKWRKGARKERALIHRNNRRGPREAMARLAQEPEGWDERPAPDDTSSREIRSLVRHRRHADKVNPFIRWATAVTHELPRERRLSHVRGLLPQGLIGEHALVHLKHAEAFVDLRQREWNLARWRRAYPSQSQRAWLDRGEHAQLLRQVLQVPDGHHTLNRWLRYHPNAGGQRWGKRWVFPRVRTLQGVHDVLPFLDALGQVTRGHKGWREWGPAHPHFVCFQAMDRFLRAFKKCRGEVTATLAELGVKPDWWTLPRYNPYRA